jgi:hypothetical protein
MMRQAGTRFDSNIGVFAMNWTFSSSPTLYEGKLYMQVLQRDSIGK